MNKMGMLVKVSMLAAVLTLAFPAFADKTSKANQSTKHTPVSKMPSVTPPKGGTEPVTERVTTSNQEINDHNNHTPKITTSTKGAATGSTSSNGGKAAPSP
jgi:hypothetical protein